MSDIYMDVDAAVVVPMNVLPLVDDTDFKTIETGLVYNSTGLVINWNFVTSAGAMTTTAITPTTGDDHDISEPLADQGMYAIEIPASGGDANNDTEGYGWISGVATGILPWRGPIITFRAAALNNALVDGGDNLDTNAVQFAGQTITAAAGVTLPSSVASPTNITAGTITTVTNLTNLPAAGALEATLAAMKGATFDTATDSLEAIRDRGDAAWTSGSAQPIPYAPTAITFTAGNDESPGAEDYTDLAAHDDTYVQCGEDASTGITFDVDAVLVGKETENPSLCRIAAFYSGVAGHELAIQAYNYVTAAYESVATMKPRTTTFDYVIPLEAENHDPANGSMKIRFLHNAAPTPGYNAAHYLRVDYVSFEKRTTTDALASDVASILATVNDIDLEVDEILEDTAEIGVAGAGLTALGDTRLANLDAAVSSRGTSTFDGTTAIGGGVTVNNALAAAYSAPELILMRDGLTVHGLDGSQATPATIAFSGTASGEWCICSFHPTASEAVLFYYDFGTDSITLDGTFGNGPLDNDGVLMIDNSSSAAVTVAGTLTMAIKDSTGATRTYSHYIPANTTWPIVLATDGTVAYPRRSNGPVGSMSQPTSGLTAQETANAVNNLAPVGTPDAGSVAAHLDTIEAAGGGGGTGDILFTWTEYQTGHQGDANYVVPDVSVRVYTNNAAVGTPEVTGITDETGGVQFYLDAGTYYVFRRKSGRVFSNPVTVEVS